MESEKKNILQQKSYQFSLKIVLLYATLPQKDKHSPITNQLLRSATSIGANVEEAIGAQSRADFFSKLYISYKEAREVLYWLHLVNDSKIIHIPEIESLMSDCTEILKILGKIRTKQHTPSAHL